MRFRSLKNFSVIFFLHFNSGSDCDDPDCRKNKSIAHKKKTHGDGVEESKEEAPPPAPSPSPAPAPLLPGAGWGRVKKDRVPDYQRFHA